MMQPNYYKYKKKHWKNKNIFENKSNKLQFGSYGLQALEEGFITAKQIEAIRRTLTNLTKRRSKVWIRIYPNFSVTKKPIESRMGKGIGRISHWGCWVKPGRILYEISGSDKKTIIKALNFAGRKFPIKIKIIGK